VYAILSKNDFQIPRFILVGTFCSGVNVCTLYLLTQVAGIWYLYSSAAAFCISYAVSFTLQKFWTFKNRGLQTAPKQLGLHLSLQLGNLALNTVLIYILVTYAGVWYLAAQVSLDATISIENFILSRRIFAV